HEHREAAIAKKPELPRQKRVRRESLRKSLVFSWVPLLPHARECKGRPAQRSWRRLQTSPVSWLGGESRWMEEALIRENSEFASGALAAFPQRAGCSGRRAKYPPY